MKNVVVIGLGFSIILSFVLSNCQPASKGPDTLKVIIKGSDTEYELVKDLCEASSINEQSGAKVKFEVTGGGTVVGFKALVNNQTDIANASRLATDKEIKLLEKNKVKYVPVMFATDAIAIITHPKLGVDSLSLQELSDIFTGKITNWKQVGGLNLPINIHSRNYLSGTYFYFKEKFIQGDFKTDVFFYESNADIVNAVARDIGGIGYVSSGFLMDRDGKPSNAIWAMPIHLDENHSSVSPYQIALITQGEYPLTRPLYQYLKQPISNAVQSLIVFELSNNGQSIIRQHGYFPINDKQREINKMKGFEYTSL